MTHADKTYTNTCKPNLKDTETQKSTMNAAPDRPASRLLMTIWKNKQKSISIRSLRHVRAISAKNVTCYLWRDQNLSATAGKLHFKRRDSTHFVYFDHTANNVDTHRWHTFFSSPVATCQIMTLRSNNQFRNIWICFGFPRLRKYLSHFIYSVKLRVASYKTDQDTSCKLSTHLSTKTKRCKPAHER